MEKKILLSDIADLLSNKANITKKSADNFVRLFFSTIEENLLADRYVKIKDFGSFKLVTVSERESVNVATGERFQISSHSKVTFTAEGMLRDQINLPFAHFTSVEMSDEVNQQALDAIVSESTEEPEKEVAPKVEETAPITPPTAEPAPEVEAASVVEAAQTSTPTEPATAPTQTEPATASTPTAAEEPTEVTAPQPTIIIQKEETTTNWWKVAFITFMVAALMVGSYFAGYYRIFNCSQAKVTKVEAADTATTKVPTTKAAYTKQPSKPAAKATSTTGTATSSKSASSASPTNLPQLPGASHKIIGTRTVHIFKTGESLRTLSLKYYGSIDYVKYIVFYNDIKNPDVIALDAKISIPELVEN